MKRLTIILLFCVSILNAQPPKRFYTTFGGQGEDIGYSAKQTLDNQYIIAGSTSSFGHGNTDAYLLKVDSMGSGIWDRTFGGLGNDVARSVVQLADSGFALAGFSNSFGNGGYDAYVARTDKYGNLLWQRTYGGEDWDFANDVVQAADGSIIVVGYFVNSRGGKKDGFIVKYDLQGTLIWQKFLDGPENDELRSIITTKDNFLACVGYTENKGDVDGDMYFMKFDTNGDTVFTRVIGGPYKDYANDLVQMSNSDYVICGAKTFSVSDYTRSYIYSMTSSGTYTWDIDYYSSYGDESIVSASKHTPDITAYLRNVPLTGFKMQGNIMIGRYTGWIERVNSFGGGDDETFYSTESTRDRGYISVGSTSSFNSVGSDIIFIKQDSLLVPYDKLVGVRSNYKSTSGSYIAYRDKEIFFICNEAKMPQRITVVDLEGRIVSDIAEPGTVNKIDIFSQASGVYILTCIFNDGSILNMKLIN